MRTGHLGIDLGTSSVKVVVQDNTGHVLAKASRAYDTLALLPGWAEQSPEAWWQATSAAVSEAVVGVEILSVGLSGQLNGFVLLDAANAPLCDAVIWLDLRAEIEAKELLAESGLDIEALTGNDLSPVSVLSKLVWFARQRPDVLARTRRIVFVKDYILMRLTGEHATDPSDAGSTAMACPGGAFWQPELVARTGLPLSALPTILPSAAIAGRVTSAASQATGLVSGTAVATGAGDVAALAVGCGIVEPARVAITLGTAGHVVAQADGAAMPRNSGLWCIPHAVPQRTLWLGLIMSGGLCLAWLRELLCAVGTPLDFAQIETLAAAAPVGGRGVNFLPFLEGAATPHRRPDARGAFFGLSSSHDAGDMLRAVMEGVAFNARECVDALAAGGVDPTEIRLAEGGSQSQIWCQTMADALARPVDLLAERDTSAVGAAILGHAAVEGASVAEIANTSVRLTRRFEPSAAGVATLNEGFSRYTDTIRRLLGP